MKREEAKKQWRSANRTVTTRRSSPRVRPRSWPQFGQKRAPSGYGAAHEGQTDIHHEAYGNRTQDPRLGPHLRVSDDGPMSTLPSPPPAPGSEAAPVAARADAAVKIYGKGENAVRALDDVTIDSGAVEFVKGSHRWGRWFEPKSFHPDRQYAAGDYEPMPDIGNQRDQYDIVHFNTRRGDVVGFHLSIVHYAPGNRTAGRRRAISIRYAGDDATYAVRRRGPKLPRDPGLKHGDKLGGDLFPVAWPPESHPAASRG